MFRKNLICAFALIISQSVIGQSTCPSGGVVYDGVCFPQGAVSFADQSVSYTVGYHASGNPIINAKDPDSALGAPDYGNISPDACFNSDTSTTPANTCEFTSLGPGGTIIVQFNDNFLTGSGDDRLDLWIFEIGVGVEDSDIQIREKGTNIWYPIGTIAGSTAGVDIDEYFTGGAVGREFDQVSIQDVAIAQPDSGPSTGADIDAVGAITSIPASVCALELVTDAVVVPGVPVPPSGHPGVSGCTELRATTDYSRPISLTFEYTGGGCGASSSGQSGPGQGEATCTSSISGAGNPVYVEAESGRRHPKHVLDGFVITKLDGTEFNGPFAVGEQFMVTLRQMPLPADTTFDSQTLVRICDHPSGICNHEGYTESNTFHTTCGVPMEAGDVYGSLTLIRMNAEPGTGGGGSGTTDLVRYSFDVTNNGDSVSDLSVCF